MKFSNPYINNILKVVLLSSSIFAVPGVFAHTISIEPTGQISKSMNVDNVSSKQARKIVRKFLSSRGFTKSIGPGGSQIRTIESKDNHWKVLVGLRDASATINSKHWLLVDKHNGAISEVTTKAEQI